MQRGRVRRYEAQRWNDLRFDQFRPLPRWTVPADQGALLDDASDEQQLHLLELAGTERSYGLADLLFVPVSDGDVDEIRLAARRDRHRWNPALLDLPEMRIDREER